MIMDSRSLTVQAVRLLNERWEEFRDELAPDAPLMLETHGHKGLAVLSVLAARRELWELAMSAAGFVQATEEVQSVFEAVEALVSDTGPSWRGDLEAYIGQVTTLGPEKLIAAAEVALLGVQLVHLQHEDVDCIGACLWQHRDNRERLRICIRGCAQ